MGLWRGRRVRLASKLRGFDSRQLHQLASIAQRHRARRCQRRDDGSTPSGGSKSGIAQWLVRGAHNAQVGGFNSPSRYQFIAAENGYSSRSHKPTSVGSTPTPATNLPLWPWWSRHRSEKPDIPVRSRGAAPSCGRGSLVDQQPSKLPRLGSIPAARSIPYGPSWWGCRPVKPDASGSIPE